MMSMFETHEGEIFMNGRWYKKENLPAMPEICKDEDEDIRHILSVAECV